MPGIVWCLTGMMFYVGYNYTRLWLFRAIKRRQRFKPLPLIESAKNALHYLVKYGGLAGGRHKPCPCGLKLFIADNLLKKKSTLSLGSPFVLR